MKQESIPIHPRENMVGFELRTYEKDMENNFKLQGCPGYLKNSKEVVTEYWGVFCEGVFYRPIRVFNSIPTQDNIYLYASNHPGMFKMVS